MSYRFVLATLLGLGFQVAGFAQFVLDTDFEGSSLESWQVSGNSIRLVGSETWSEFPDSYRWVHFRVSGSFGERPVFRIGSLSNQFLGDLDNHRFVYSYDAKEWHFFDNNRGSNSQFTFSNSRPFTQDQVFVAYSTPYPFSKTTDYVREKSQLWFVSPTVSSNTNLEIDQVANLPLYGFQITNPLSTQPKSKILLVGGNHSGEAGASFALQGVLDFVTDENDPRAAAMRDVAEFYVYPQVDPLGRTEGYFRGNSQNPANDHNRFWDALSSGNDGGFAEIPILASAMKLDTDSRVEYAFDFHGFFDSGPNFLFSDLKGVRSDYVKNLTALDPTIRIEQDDRVEPLGIFEFWAKTRDGLNADFSFTSEFSPNRLSDELLALGNTYALAMYETLGKPVRTQKSSEIDHLTSQVMSDAVDLVFDFDKDLDVSPSDRIFFVHEVLHTYFGDSNLDGEFNTGDFVDVFQAGEYEDSILRNSRWATGDWNGDFEFSTSDLVFAFQYGGFEKGPRVPAVPEPAGFLLLTMILCPIFVHSRR